LELQDIFIKDMWDPSSGWRWNSFADFVPPRCPKAYWHALSYSVRWKWR